MRRRIPKSSSALSLAKGKIMRNLVFKNLTSKDHTRKIILAKETFEEEGISTVIQKHLIYFVRQIKQQGPNDKVKPELFIIKQKNSHSKTEAFLVKMKAGMYIQYEGNLYVINFLHSLKIFMSPSKMATSPE